MATNFEEITKSPEVLGAFLASLPYLEGPWDTEFQRNFCAGCGQVTCDPICRYQRFRNNPSWWLTLEAEQCEQGTHTSDKTTVQTEPNVIEIDPAEAEKLITTEQEAETERLRPMFRYFMGKDHETGAIEIGAMDGGNVITFSEPEEARWFIKHLSELIQDPTIRRLEMRRTSRGVAVDRETTANG